MSGNHVLVVEENTDRREKLSTLIEFVNCRPVVVDDPTIWFDQVDNLSDIVMAIIGDCGNHHITRQLLRELVNHESRVPVFTLDLPDSDMQEFPGTIGSLRFPIKYPQLSNALQQATIYRGQTHHDQDDNSLFRSLVGNRRSQIRIHQLKKPGCRMISATRFSRLNFGFRPVHRTTCRTVHGSEQP